MVRLDTVATSLAISVVLPDDDAYSYSYTQTDACTKNCSDAKVSRYSRAAPIAFIDYSR